MERRNAITRNGISIVFREQQGELPAVVLVHGLSSSRHIWDRVLPLLSPLRVIAYDQRGHGESDKPESGYAFGDMTADLEAVLDATGIERAVLAGHSWGGNVAVEFAATRPERTLGIVLVDGGIGQLSARPGMTRDRALELLQPPDIDGMPVADLLSRIQENSPMWSDEFRDIVLASFYLNDDGTIRRRFPLRQHMQVVEALWDQQLLDLYPKVRCPAVLVPAYMDSGDGVAERMAAKREGVTQALTLLADAHLEEMNDTIHDVPVQRPAELAAVIKALAVRAAGAPTA